MKKCKYCRFWEQIINECGECHRYAPQPQFMERGIGRADNLWVATYSEEWCGEFEDKK